MSIKWIIDTVNKFTKK
ncbi:TPA: delta-lysin family phenol-soluble modulin [Staphylococcus aureus]|nr:delta-lysin family phenol-soluble modulin [Staphylococcus aureus]HEK4515677.1 delta-lysin family phenol-soluble modulin [Staphylococcus aureus]